MSDRRAPLRFYELAAPSGKRAVHLPGNAEWDRQLRALAAAIRKAAKGRVCGECAHYSGGCVYTLNLEVVSHRETAPVCPSFSPAKIISPKSEKTT